MIAAYILIQTEAGKAATVAAALRELPGVSETASLARPYDVIARVQAPDIDELAQARLLPGPRARRRAADDELLSRPL